MIEIGSRVAVALQSGLIPRGTRVEVFQRIYWVFLALGTLVGIVVIGYMLWNAYKYREGGAHAAEGDDDRPQLGEIPTGGGKGKKLFLSFTLSAIIVISLIVWTYGTLLYVEASPGEEVGGEGEALTVEVVGHQFYWEFVYPNGYSTRTSGVMRVPADREIELQVTSADVFHNFGIPGQRVKTDAIPGHTTESWFVADTTGNYSAACYELCGQAHSYMTATVVVMEPDEFQEWYGNTSDNTTPTPTPSSEGGGDGGGH